MEIKFTYPLKKALKTLSLGFALKNHKLNYIEKEKDVCKNKHHW